MSHSSFSWTQIGQRSTFFAVGSGLGSALVAAARGGNIKESSAVVGLGAGLFTAGLGTAFKFGFGAEEGQPTAKKLTLGMHITRAAFLNCIGASIGYLGTKLFINAAVSTEPFVDATIGVPITAGLLFCGGLLLNYYDQNQNVQNAGFKPCAL